MKDQIRFDKYEGLGNDFVLIDRSVNPKIGPLEAEDVVRLCDRRFGVGADGVLLFSLEDNRLPVRMEYYNADGGRAETCFNGLRCIARHAVRRGVAALNEEFTILTDAGEVKATVSAGGEAVTTAMGGAVLEPERVPVKSEAPVVDRPLALKCGTISGTALALGNPHFVVWAEGGDLDVLNRKVAEQGDAVEHDPVFPRGVNFEIARVVGAQEALMAVWERGVGVTMACGSGATATAIAGVATGRFTAGKPIKISMRGGSLTVQVTPDLTQVLVTGPAHHVFSGTLDGSRWLKRRSVR